MEAARKMEFLQIVLNSPIAQQIVGIPGAAELLRDMAENFEINTDKLVPDEQQANTMQQQQMMIQQLQQQLMQMQQALGMAQQQSKGQGTPPKAQTREMLPDGSSVGGREANLTASRFAG
jgi:DNA primase